MKTHCPDSFRFSYMCPHLHPDTGEGGEHVYLAKESDIILSKLALSLIRNVFGIFFLLIFITF